MLGDGGVHFCRREVGTQTDTLGERAQDAPGGIRVQPLLWRQRQDDQCGQIEERFWGKQWLGRLLVALE